MHTELAAARPPPLTDPRSGQDAGDDSGGDSGGDPGRNPIPMARRKIRGAADSQLGMETTPRSSVGPPPQATVSAAVLAWRRRRLVASGFDEVLAASVASSRIDLHELLALLDRGCPPHLAARILAPIERPELRALSLGMCSPVSPWPPGSTVIPVPRGPLT